MKTGEDFPRLLVLNSNFSGYKVILNAGTIPKRLESTG